MTKIKLLVVSLFAGLFFTVLVACNNDSEVRTHRVRFDSEGGSIVEDQFVKDGQKVAIPDEITKPGHTFYGWFLGTTQYDFSSPVTNYLNLTAKYTINKYTYTIDCNGGGGCPEPVELYYDQHFPYFEYPSTYGDSLFGGFFIDKECTTYSGYSKMPDFDLTIYAKWIPFETLFNYTLSENNEATITEFTGDMYGDIIIPNTIDGYPVVAVDNRIFEYYRDIKSLTFRSNIRDINLDIFYQIDLEAVYVDESNQYYSSLDGVLYNKEKTKILKYPEFKSDLYFTLPSSVTTIPRGTFISTVNLKEIIFADGSELKTVENNAFECASIEHITFPEGLEYIGVNAFRHCDKLISINLPSTLSSIELNAFEYTYLLEEIDVAAANQVYSSLDGVLYNKNKTNIIKYPEGKINKTFIVISSVRGFEDESLDKVRYLQEFYVDSANQYFATIDGVLFTKDYKCLYEYPDGKIGETYNIPEGVSSIEHFAFSYVDDLRIINVSKDVKVINHCAFYFCDNLTDINFADECELSYVSPYSIFHCESLNTVVFPLVD